MLLAGDVGGTKTTLAVFSGPERLKFPLLERVYSSHAYLSLETIVDEFLSQSGQTPDYAAFGVAGPVVDGRARITNLPWLIDESRLQRNFGFARVHLLNDLEAIAEGVPILEACDLEVLHEGQAAAGGTVAVIAPGTGLGEAFLTWNGSRYKGHASEGGHTSFGPLDDLQIEMLRYLMKRYGHVSYERVCSGSGFPNIYAFLKDTGYGQEPAWLSEKLALANDPTPVLVDAALSETEHCEMCSRALEIFVSILGSEAGNLVLKVMATGGLYLGGGIPPRILPLLKTDCFSGPLFDKGRLSGVLDKLPVYVILNPEVGLLGAAHFALELQRITS